MHSSLQPLFAVIDRAKNESELQSHLVPKLGELFVARRRGIFFFDRFPAANPSLQKALQVGLSLERNPVVRYLVERHAPVHEALVTSPKVWAAICPRPDHRHVMVGPIVRRNQLIGTVGCTRDRSMPAFDTQDLGNLSAICLHLSIWASTRQSQPQPLKTNLLTPRERQIAELVALGRTNAKIGEELWITENSVKQALKRMFRKLQVSSRAEMVARLSATE